MIAKIGVLILHLRIVLSPLLNGLFSGLTMQLDRLFYLLVNGNQKCSDFGNSECSIFGIKTTVLLASAVQ